MSINKSIIKPKEAYAVRAFTHKKVKRAVELEQSERVRNGDPRTNRLDIIADVLEKWADTKIQLQE